MAVENPNDSTPISYGLNSRLVKTADGTIQEMVYSTEGLYGNAIKKIVEMLEAAKEVAENDVQKKYISELVAYTAMAI